jgi:SAM-dependent methyltransferase
VPPSYAARGCHAFVGEASAPRESEPQPIVAKQSDASVKKNRSFFNRNAAYLEGVGTIDTYGRIRAAINLAIAAPGTLLDVGNGGVFDYDVAAAGAVTALDLFVDNIDIADSPPNVTFVQGSALDLPFGAAAFDTVLIVMLMHHLVGNTIGESAANVDRSIAEARRVLRPDGRLIVVESCVPAWFYGLEKAVFPLALRTLDRIVQHPVTVQYTQAHLRGAILAHFTTCDVINVPKGKYVLQYGLKVPSWATPVQVEVFVATAPPQTG